jgi:hypothetical protein
MGADTERGIVPASIGQSNNPKLYSCQSLAYWRKVHATGIRVLFSERNPETTLATRSSQQQHLSSRERHSAVRAPSRRRGLSSLQRLPRTQPAGKINPILQTKLRTSSAAFYFEQSQRDHPVGFNTFQFRSGTAQHLFVALLEQVFSFGDMLPEDCPNVSKLPLVLQSKLGVNLGHDCQNHCRCSGEV